MYQTILSFSTHSREDLYDITDKVREALAHSGVHSGLCSVYAQGATGAVMIQENRDDSIRSDVIDLLSKLVPRGIWRHDAEDGNGDSHLKAGVVGPSETIPVVNGRLGLSRWQNIFFCEFDGPRRERKVMVTVIGEKPYREDDE